MNVVRMMLSNIRNVCSSISPCYLHFGLPPLGCMLSRLMLAGSPPRLFSVCRALLAYGGLRRWCGMTWGVLVFCRSPNCFVLYRHEFIYMLHVPKISSVPLLVSCPDFAKS